MTLRVKVQVTASEPERCARVCHRPADQFVFERDLIRRRQARDARQVACRRLAEYLPLEAGNVHGRAIHPGWAKGELVNAIKLAGEILSRLPQDGLSPETTDGREGYVHPVLVDGDSSEVELRFIVRDFEDDRLDEHIAFLRALAEEVAAGEPRCSIEVEDRIQYRNMRDALASHPEIVANLEEAIRRVGLEPKQTSIRGGTDGSALTEMGLPTPNVFTGGHDAHSEREWICVEDMGLAAATLIELARVWADGQHAY